MDLHPEVEMFALLGGSHLRVALILTVLPRRRGVYDGGADYGSSGEPQPFRSHAGADILEDPFAKVMGLE